MGTRSTITFYEKRDDKLIPYVNIYQQYDGYLEGVGEDLCIWLKNKIIVNGFSSNDKRDIANGIGCLIAQYIRDNKDDVGDLYIYPIGKCCEDCDYNYSVIIDESWMTSWYETERKAEDITTIEVSNWRKNPFFKGTIQELLGYIKNQKEEDI